jgi:hypothetical protein
MPRPQISRASARENFSSQLGLVVSSPSASAARDPVAVPSRTPVTPSPAVTNAVTAANTRTGRATVSRV